MIAKTTPWGSIKIGKDFYKLTEFEQEAVLAHEEGHVMHRHSWIRLKWFLTLKVFFKTEEFLKMCEAQEFQADRYAASRGHTAGLIYFLWRRQYPDGKAVGYPTAKQRIEALSG